MPPRPRPPIDRFATKVALTDDGCLEWLGGKTVSGYGQFHAANDGSKASAHRWSYEYHVGPIPDGMEIDHLCRNRACVNPDHLEAVTHVENLMRSTGFPAIHARQTHCINGHELAGENLALRTRPSGGRTCKTCSRDRDRQRQRQRQRRKAS